MRKLARTGLILFTAAAALFAAGCESTQLVPAEDDQASSAIQGLDVVWEDSRNEETDGTDVYTYNSQTGVQSLVAGGNGDQTEPAISDSQIVWLSGGRLKAKNRSSGSVSNVAGSPTQSNPALCGSVVTWSDSRNATTDVYARNLAGGQEIAVATTGAEEAYPACDNGRIVYMHAPTGEWAGIRLYDIASGQTTTVSDRPYNEWRPAISGDRVVWQAWPNQPDTTEGIQILGKRLSTGDTFTVTNGPNQQTAPVISGTLVAWEDARDGKRRVWWRDVASTIGEQDVDPRQLGRQQSPAVSGRVMTFESDATGAWNIYMNMGLLIKGF